MACARVQIIHKEYIKNGKGKDLGFEQVTLFESKISAGNGEQALSRDFSRLCEQMDLTRLLSFFHSSNGFYWSNLFVIWSTSWFVYVQILISIVIPDQVSAKFAAAFHRSHWSPHILIRTEDTLTVDVG